MHIHVTAKKFQITTKADEDHACMHFLVTVSNNIRSFEFKALVDIL